MRERVIAAMRAEFRHSLAAIMEGNDPHLDVMQDTIAGYREHVLADYMERIDANKLPPPSILAIKTAVAEMAGVSAESMGQGRSAAKVRPMQIAMFIAVKRFGYGYSHIGRRFNRDHTTVMSNCKTINRLCQKDEACRSLVAKAIARLEAAA